MQNKLSPESTSLSNSNTPVASSSLANLNWANHSGELLQSINRCQYTDLAISVEGDIKVWNVHKIIVASGCELIRNLLMDGNNGDPIPSHPPNIDSLILTSITSSQLNNLIDYLYTGEIKLPKDEIPEFLGLCKYFGVKGIEQGALGEVEDVDKEESDGKSESILGKALTMDVKKDLVVLGEMEGRDEHENCENDDDDDDLNGSDEDTTYSSLAKADNHPSTSFPLDLTNFLNQLQHSNPSRAGGDMAGSNHEDDNNEPLLLGQILRNNIETQLMMINGNSGAEKCKGNKTGRGSELSNSSSTSQLMSTLFQLAQQQPNASLSSIPNYPPLALSPPGTNIQSPSSSPQPQQLCRVRATDPRPCPKCNKIYRSAHTLRTHLEDKHTTCPGYRCVLCGTVAKSRNSLHSHMSRQHRGISTKDLPVLPMPSPFDPVLANQLLNNGGKGQWGNTNVDLNETDGPNVQQSQSINPPNKSSRSKHSSQHFNDYTPPQPHQLNAGTTGSALLDTYLQFIAENSSSLCAAAAAVAAAVEANNVPQQINDSNNHIGSNNELSPARSNRRNNKRKIDDENSIG